MCLLTPLTEEITTVKSLCKYRTWMCHCLKWSQRYWLSQVSYNRSYTVMLVVFLTFSGLQWLTPATITFMLVYIFKLHSCNDEVFVVAMCMSSNSRSSKLSTQVWSSAVLYLLECKSAQNASLVHLHWHIIYPPNVYRKPQQMKLTLPSGKLFKMPSMTVAAVDSKWKLYSMESSAVKPWRSMQFTGAALTERVTSTQLLNC